MNIREGADKCPGVLRPFVSGDGSIVRVHAPGGRVKIDQLQQLLEVATAFGAPFIQLTSRGNLQLRGLPDPVPAAVTERLQSAGFLEHPEHERVRNIVAPPSAAFDDLIGELDAALVADQRLAHLSGRWLFVLSDDSGWGLAEPFDVAFMGDPQRGGRVLVGHQEVDVDPSAIVPTMIAASLAFLNARSDSRQWNVRDLPETLLLAQGRPATASAGSTASLGQYGEDAIVGLPLGQLAVNHLAAIANLTDRVVVTPWRSVVIPHAGSHLSQLTAEGFITNGATAWARITACPGAPYCVRTDSPTVELAARAAFEFAASGPRLHIAGCERSCGAPSSEHIGIINPHCVDDLRVQGAS